MYKNILIATDGTELSRKAEEHGINLAKTIGAKITGVTVTMPATAYMSSEVAVALDMKVFEERTAAMAKRNLDAIFERADNAGVTCETMRAENSVVHEGIIETAERARCDLIVMASHGRSGISGFIIGSETTKVLTHSKIPVLVVR